VFRQNQLVLKKFKCIFRQTKIPFWKHWIGYGCIQMDPMKVKEIEYWEEKQTVHDMRVLLGTTNNYRNFL